jgi:hypothetical protein
MAAKRPSDPQGRHVRIYCSLLNTPAWRALSKSARALFLDLRASITASNNGNVSAPLSTLKHRDWRSSQTLSAALYQLRALGFLAVTVEGGLKQGGRRPTLYAFTDLDVFEHPKHGIAARKAGHEYRAFNSVAEAKHSLEVGVEKLRSAGRRKQRRGDPAKARVPNSKRTGSTTKLQGEKSSSKTEQDVSDPVPKRNKGNHA